jgi:hypothetical protein
MYTTTIPTNRTASLTLGHPGIAHVVRKIAAGVAAALLSVGLFFVAAGSGSSSGSPTSPAGPSTSIDVLSARNAPAPTVIDPTVAVTPNASIDILAAR